MDIRHPCQAFDEELLDWAGESELPIRVLLNKADKLNFGAQKKLFSFAATLRRSFHRLFQTFSTRGEVKPR